MSLSEPINQNVSNTGVQRVTNFGKASVPDPRTASPLNQIRGVSAKGSTGAGIPKHVSSVASQVANASTGTTSAVSVTYKRDPSDASHQKVNVYVKGYQGNSSPVQVASGSESPVTFVLNNTGESVSLLVQAQGNSGAAPLETAPSTGVRLPKATGGGYSTTTVTNTNTTTPPPALGAGAFMISDGVLTVSEYTGGFSAITSVSNRVRVFKFNLPISITISKCSVREGTGGASHFAFGIYDVSGNKLIDSGVFTGAGGVAANYQKTFSAVTLAAGTYYFAQTCDDAISNSSTVAMNLGTGSTGLNAGTNIVWGKAANASAVGVLPSSLGAITADVTDGTMAIVLWET